MPPNFAAERIGVGAAQVEFGRWGWAFREQPVSDFGIDAHVEPYGAGGASGQLLALQIKSGPSWFAEPVTGGWIYRGHDRHLRYWLRHCLPVILLLHDPDSGATYWEHVTSQAAEYTEVSWKMVVPAAHVLGAGAAAEFAAIAAEALGAAADPVEESCALLPPVTAEVIREAHDVEPGGALRLASMLAAGREAPRLTAQSVLSGAPSWLSRGEGRFEVAVATYAGEHGHGDVASDAMEQAARYPQQPAARLLGFAAVYAGDAGNAQRAGDLVSLAEDGGPPSLLLATARAMAESLGQAGPAAIPDVLAAASPADLAAEPTCLAFLGAQALRRQDATAAVGYLREGCAANPVGSSMMLQLAHALQARVVSGQSAVEAEDLRQSEEAARRALEQRRRWSGPSSPALAMLIRRQMLAGAFEAAALVATPAPDGEALGREADADEVVILGTQAALTLGDLDRARQFASRAGTEYGRRVIAALLADPGLDADQEAALWLAALEGDPPGESVLLALHRLACLGQWPPPGLDELRDSGVIDDLCYDILTARARAAAGDLASAVSVLRNHAATSPVAAEMLVDLLQEAGRFDEALDEAARGFGRFGESILAHKRLNLLVLADQPDEAAAEAIRLLARADTAPELRLRTRRRLISHHAYRSDWPAMEEQAREALGEFPGLADLQWALIGSIYNRGQPDRAWQLLDQFRPEITTMTQVGLWLGQHLRCGFSQQDVGTALDLLDRWPGDENFEGQVLAVFLGAAGRCGPAGNLILPDLDPPTRDRFQARLASYTGRNPDGPIQAVSGDPQDLADMLRAQLAPQAEQIENLEREVRAGRASLATLAAVLRRSYARALIQRACGVIVAVDIDPAAFDPEFEAATAAIDGPVIIQSSAVAVATGLPDRWPGLRGAFTEVRLPRDAWADFQAAHDDLQRDPEASVSIGYDLRRQELVSHQLSEADHAYLRRRTTDIRNAMNGMTITPTPDLGAFADYSPATSDAAFSPLALAASTGLPLWCDDVAIRVVARQHGIPAFGTLALLHALVETGRLPDALRHDVLDLARGYVTDMMLTLEELLTLAAEARYQPGPATTIISRPVFWADPTTARQVFLEMITAVRDHAPEAIATWLTAACTGLEARHSDDLPGRDARSLAEAVAAHVHADDDLHSRLIHVSSRCSGAKGTVF